MDYFKNKEENKAKAIRTFSRNEVKYGDIINSCYRKSTIYNEDTTFMCTSVNPNMVHSSLPKFMLYCDTSENAVLEGQKFLMPKERIAVLNFSSYKKPGGMFFEGSMAQMNYLFAKK